MLSEGNRALVDASVEARIAAGDLFRRGATWRFTNEEVNALLDAARAEGAASARGLVENAFHEGRHSCSGTNRHRAEDAWRVSGALARLKELSDDR